MAKIKTKHEMITVAILDSSKRFIGTEEVSATAALTDQRIKVDKDIDLPTDASYKWDELGQCFMPLGHGFGKPKKCPVPDQLVLYQLLKDSENKTSEAKDWLNWYEGSLKDQHEELVVNHSKRGKA